MEIIGSERQLAVALSKLKGFEKPKVRAEQYITDSNIAAKLLWHMFIGKSTAGKTIADLGSGTGILGLGALLMGAKKVFLVENDPDAMEIAKENYNTLKKEYEMGEAVFVLKDVTEFNEKVKDLWEKKSIEVILKEEKKAIDKIKQASKAISNNLYYAQLLTIIQSIREETNRIVGGDR